MSTIRFTLIAVLLASSAAAAQEKSTADSSARWTVGATQFRAGGLRLGLGSLNTDLARNGRPVFSNTIPSFGISTYARKGRVLFGASADGSLPRRGAQGGWVTKLAAGSATLDGGLALIDASRTFVYTMLSVGVRSTSLHFERDGDFTYSEGLQDPARGVDLASKGGIAQIGISAERRFEARRLGRFALAAQTGWVKPFGSAATFAGENRVRQTPDQTAGSYIRLAFSKPIAKRGRVMDTLGAALLSTLAW